MNFEIKRLSEKDSFAVAEIEKQCFSNPWSEATVSSEIKSRFSDFFGAFSEEKLVGYIGGRTIAEETEIFNVAVSPEFRRKGIAKSLIEKFVEAVRKKETSVIFLEVRASNLSAIALYEKSGFVFCGIRKDYYTNPKENALLMRLAFDGTQEYEEWDDDE
ncbi:MAG: ribosomal protein S18-alanine N-acetyltransferase [Oscillospiraceae bacterium]|nr:ribosomal protein S18-alanine N-acetyltransferase [Oscillospiraceae bacterium]